MRFLRPFSKFFLILSVTVFLIACGGGSDSSSTTGSTTSGKLVPEVRAVGFSDTYNSNPDYKDLVDNFLIAMDATVREVESAIKWESNIPVVFSGCGQVNAFFGTGLDVHAAFSNQGIANPAAVFGANVTGNVLVMCHEITERALQEFFLDATTQQNIIDTFSVTTIDEFVEGATFSALVFELQILFHEIGHGMDFLLLKDAVNNATKQQNFTIPIPNTCGQAGCDTISEDFADWISAHILVEALKDEIATQSQDAGKLAAGWLVALNAWSRILGTGGDVAHGFTLSRQVNMLCYAYGSIPELRAADANNLGSGLANVMTGQGLDPNNCQSIYQSNETSTTNLLSSFVN